VFRGALDAGAVTINGEMEKAAAQALASLVGEDLSAGYILPAAFDPRICPAVAQAVADAARRTGVVRK
jgi:malate dehydrogenase (oxaloacetate-decarboxylating)